MFPRVSVTGLALVLAACSGAGSRTSEMRSFHGAYVGAPADPTVRPARLLPASIDESTTYGTESGGGVRLLSAGLRVVSYRGAGSVARGALAVAEDRLPAAPQVTTALPARLGGGFLFTLGSAVWRADRWLGPARPIFNAPASVSAVLPGLDRVYLRAQNGMLAIDGRDGKVLDLGPFPASPLVASYAAADGWRAAAVADLRGVVATFDAGATWKTIDLPIDPKQVVATSDSLAIAGFENTKEAWFELRADGGVARLGSAPREAKVKLVPTTGATGRPPAPARSAEPEPEPASEAIEEDFATKTFGRHPIAAAIEDGWPLTDGTAVVARDGALARIRIADGALTELVRDAFPLSPASCHPVSLTRPSAVGAFGFVCAEPRGTTVVYAYEPLRGRLSELRRFQKPRVVTASGTGALAVRGPCAVDADPTAPARPEDARPPEDGPDGGARPSSPGPRKPEPRKPDAPAMHPYCVLGHDDAWREIHVRGDAGSERVVVLGDDRVVILSPPEAIGAPARLTLLDHGQARTVPVTFPKVTPDVARVLRLGLWLDGFEERRPGVLGGWIEAGGTMLGVEVALDGAAKAGDFIRDAGLPFVSGRYGLGWTTSRRGYETTDGGMTWAPLDLPEPLVPRAKVERRACGPIGCLASGWLRVGWGETKRTPPAALPASWRPNAALAPVPLNLDCDPLAAQPPAVKEVPGGASLTHVNVRSSIGGGPPVLGTFNGQTELPAFFHQAATAFRDPDRGLSIDVHELSERASNIGPLARIYGWGPKTGDWETLGHWQVRWLSPFAGWPELRTTLASTPPAPIIDLARGTGWQWNNAVTWQLAAGEDPAHALLVGRRRGSDLLLFELEADRAAIEVRRADGEPFGDVDGLVRASGRWLVATAPMTTNAAPVSILWQIEGGVARELARIPRILPEGEAPRSGFSNAAPKTRLARRTDGRTVGFVVDGQSTPDRSVSQRWVVPVDLETGAVREPELLGYADLAGRALEACTDDMAGWVLDTPISSNVTVRNSSGQGRVTNVYGRVRLTGERACVERLAGGFDAQGSAKTAALTRPGPTVRNPQPRSGELLLGALSGQIRWPLRCTVGK